MWLFSPVVFGNDAFKLSPGILLTPTEWDSLVIYKLCNECSDLLYLSTLRYILLGKGKCYYSRNYYLWTNQNGENFVKSVFLPSNFENIGYNFDKILRD